MCVLVIYKGYYYSVVAAKNLLILIKNHLVQKYFGMSASLMYKTRNLLLCLYVFAITDILSADSSLKSYHKS